MCRQLRSALIYRNQDLHICNAFDSLHLFLSLLFAMAHSRRFAVHPVIREARDHAIRDAASWFTSI
ncbi:hypothetical protein E2C01_090355 [Portunus trituberculatus]|uniref:Uncharacterized protein n=1 Tax=Portunus trituberculatus TaxID=210409 RepID=A0A5B7JQ39_PORTR|nr:hypothetical protein [Portunus trituberculatus]